MPVRIHLGDRLTVLRGALRGARGWSRPAVRARARAAVSAVAGSGRRDRLAIAHLAEDGAREALLRRPQAIRRAQTHGADILTSAAASGRGVIVSYCHFGPFPGLAPSLAPCVPRLHAVSGPWLADPPPDVPQPSRVRRWRALFEDADIALVSADRGASERIRSLLAAGEVVTMTFDWPGPVETRFLGRPTWLVSGSARLAIETGALVVPAMRRWRRLLPETIVAPPLDPRDHSGWQDLHGAIAAVHERWIAAAPAALEDPRRQGAWGATATAESWGPVRR